MARRTVVLAVFTLACSTSQDSSTSVELQVRAVAAEGDVGLVAPDDRGSTLAIDAAHLDIAELAVQMPAGERCSDIDDAECDGDDWVVIPGPFNVDLYAGISAATMTLPSGTYRKARAMLVRPDPEMGADGADEPADDDDTETEPTPAFTAGGAVDVQGVNTRVEIGLVPADILFNGPAEVMDEDAVQHLVLALDVSNWLAGVSLKDCVLRHDPEDGPFLIDETATGVDDCTAGIADHVRANIEASGELLASE